ncbi:Type IV leader peptidase family protein [Actinomadura rubteroloni]|uniref:Type IV leader peptidase family protein n=1 Tax=Actinomadura rubteroloni TaxID=1926885 RepID=A0A2P4UG40_9ACTN|nr:A24 family peptidase [Actinomadura rubteroloni]POM24025.1 Type IV leader peptidase family protein [Actinomadura rubteroloni]
MSDFAPPTPPPDPSTGPAAAPPVDPPVDSAAAPPSAADPAGPPDAEAGAEAAAEEEPTAWSWRADWTEPLWRRPALTVAACALAAAVLGARTFARPELAAVLYLGVVGALLVLVDLKLHRLPNPLTLPSYPIALALLGAAAAVEGDALPFVHALIGLATLWTLYAVQWFLLPGQIGFGDVKLAGVLGLYLGWYGSDAWVTGVVVTYLSGGLVAVGLLLARRRGRRDAIPYGPFMVAGTFAAILAFAG